MGRTTDGSGNLSGVTEDGGGDLSAAVVLDPVDSARNVIHPAADVIGLTVRGGPTDTAKVFQVLRGADGFEALSVFGAQTRLYGLTMQTGGITFEAAGGIWTSAYAGVIDFQGGRVIVGAGGAANARLVVVGDVAQSGNLQEWKDSALTIRASIGPTGNLSVPNIDVGNLNATGAIQSQYSNLNLQSQNEAPLFLGNLSGAGVNTISGLKIGANATQGTGIFDTTFQRAAPGVWEIPQAGGGLKLKSPDGTVTKTLTIDNAGAIALL